MPWLWMGWQPLALVAAAAPACGELVVDRRPLPQQPCLSGGVWVQLPSQQGISSVALACSPTGSTVTAPGPQPRHPLVVEALTPPALAHQQWLVACDINEQGLVACRGLMGWSSWRDRCGCAASAIGVSSGMPGIWPLITASTRLPVHSLGPPRTAGGWPERVAGAAVSAGDQ